MHPSAIEIESLLKDCEVTRTRRTGPGGQHRNRTESAIVLHHLPSGVRAEASERRSQHENKQVAIQRLRLYLAIAVRTERHLSQGPSELWRGRCQQGRIKVSGEHEDYPALLAEALDLLERNDLQLKPAAEFLGCSSSQLVRLIKQQPQAFEHFNRQRQQRGLAILK